MGHPSSSHRDADTTTHRAHRTSSSQHHHHRTISSTTLLLVLSLILAVLAVMLSLPSRHSHSSTSAASAASAIPIIGDGPDHAGTSAGFWGYLTPKRSHALVSRESNVALREAEVARREAELLAQAPGGIAISCPPCSAVVEEHHYEPSPQVIVAAPPPPPPPVTTTIEIVKTVEVTPSPSWVNSRVQEILDREMKIADREKDVGKREDTIGRRESDATRREGWISEQIAHLQPPVEHVETEEYVYEAEPQRHYYGEARRPPPKVAPIPVAQPSATVVHHHRPAGQVPVPPPSSSAHATQAPAHTHGPADPTPETFVKTSTGVGARPTREVFVEVEEPAVPKTVVVESRTKVGGARKVVGGQGAKVKRREGNEETVFETIYQARNAPSPPPMPKGPEGQHPKTHRKWFGAEW